MTNNSITFPDNYHILQDDELLNISRRTCRMIYHQPIWPNGASDEAMKQLKDEVFRVIQSELVTRQTDTPQEFSVQLN